MSFLWLQKILRLPVPACLLAVPLCLFPQRRLQTLCSLLLAISLFLPQKGERLLADDSNPAPAPFTADETRHGFSEFSTMPTLPTDSSTDDSSHQHRNLPDSSTSLDEPPDGLFLNIQLAEGFEEELGLRKGHIIYPVNPTDTFYPDSRVVYVVFSVHKHYTAYQVFGRLYHEGIEDVQPDGWLDDDTIYLTTEDEGGYLEFFPSSGEWKPGNYRIEMYIGFEINPVNRMGTMRFSVKSNE